MNRENLSHVEQVKDVTVIIPTLNEEAGIGSTLSELKGLNVREVIVVDGGSLDGTAEIAERTGAHVIVERGFGYGKAIIRGLQEAKGDYVAIIDGDYTYDPNEIGKLVKILDENKDIAVVFGARTGYKKSLADELLNSTFSIWYRKKAVDVASSLIVARKNTISKLGLSSPGFDVLVEMRAKLATRGFTTVEVPIAYRQRQGNKKLALRHGFKILQRILQESLNP